MTPEKDIARFISKTVQVGDCIEWSGTKNPAGYGLFHLGKRGQNTLAHRFAWKYQHGDVPEGLLVCHKCDNPSCVNVDHLFLGTHKDNMRDCRDKGRLNISGLPVGHKSQGMKNGTYTTPESRVYGTKNGNSKIDESIVKNIISLSNEGFSTRKIAGMVCVGKTAVGRIIAGTAWKHVERI
jgi:hypothetical protein